MRLPPVDFNAQAASLPMREPKLSMVAICPKCRGKLRRTAELCHHCGAERQWGPTRAEALICTLLGTGVVPALSALLVRPSAALAIYAAIGALLGFFFAQTRFGGDRWIRAARPSRR